MMELKLTTAALIAAFEVRLAPSATEDCMAMEDCFLDISKGGKVRACISDGCVE